jgi:hypothetical protein
LSKKKELRPFLFHSISVKYDAYIEQLKMAFLRDIFNFGESKNAHEHVYGGGNYGEYQNNQQQHHHKSSWTHEIVSGAAGFAGTISFLSIFKYKYVFLSIDLDDK